jgi:hypothetical protein
MAKRKPLVNAGGYVQELPAGDVLDGVVNSINGVKPGVYGTDGDVPNKHVGIGWYWINKYGVEIDNSVSRPFQPNFLYSGPKYSNQPYLGSTYEAYSAQAFPLSGPDNKIYVEVLIGRGTTVASGPIGLKIVIDAFSNTAAVPTFTILENGDLLVKTDSGSGTVLANLGKNLEDGTTVRILMKNRMFWIALDGGYWNGIPTDNPVTNITSLPMPASTPLTGLRRKVRFIREVVNSTYCEATLKSLRGDMKYLDGVDFPPRTVEDNGIVSPDERIPSQDGILVTSMNAIRGGKNLPFYVGGLEYAVGKELATSNDISRRTSGRFSWIRDKNAGGVVAKQWLDGIARISDTPVDNQFALNFSYYQPTAITGDIVGCDNSVAYYTKGDTSTETASFLTRFNIRYPSDTAGIENNTRGSQTGRQINFLTHAPAFRSDVGRMVYGGSLTVYSISEKYLVTGDLLSTVNFLENFIEIVSGYYSETERVTFLLSITGKITAEFALNSDPDQSAVLVYPPQLSTEHDFYSLSKDTDGKLMALGIHKTTGYISLIKLNEEINYTRPTENYTVSDVSLTTVPHNFTNGYDKTNLSDLAVGVDGTVVFSYRNIDAYTSSLAEPINVIYVRPLGGSIVPMVDRVTKQPLKSKVGYTVKVIPGTSMFIAWRTTTKSIATKTVTDLGTVLIGDRFGMVEVVPGNHPVIDSVISFAISNGVIYTLTYDSTQMLVKAYDILGIAIPSSGLPDVSTAASEMSSILTSIAG